MPRLVTLSLLIFMGGVACGGVAAAADDREFRRNVRPLLEKYCFDCHADGANKGKVAFDEFKSHDQLLGDHDLWLRALQNLRAGLMPPLRKPQPQPEEKARIEQWIKDAVFKIDPKNPDPGRVTIRRLNRVEYRNTIRDLVGVEFDAATAFPPDDTGHGFDNIGDVLTLSPMLLEKYLLAANQIVREAVPATAKVVREQVIPGRQFQGQEGGDGGGRRRSGGLALSYYSPAIVAHTFSAALAGKYELALDLMVNERFVDNVFDYNKCRLILRVDGQERWRGEYGWQGGKPYHYQMDAAWAKGDHRLEFELVPLTPDEKQTRSLSLQISAVTVRGPMAVEHWIRPKNYERFFPREVPVDASGRTAYARELLGGFARRAFRRPVEADTLDRLVRLAEGIYSQPGKTFEAGVAQGMVAILASPRFLFREETPAPVIGQKGFPPVDEFALASRLSYFLWSSMPDEELLRLAEAGQLRRQLTAQVARLLKDERAQALVRNFTGQWLRARDIEGVPLEPRFILAREEKFDPETTRNRQRFRELNEQPDGQLSAAEKEELKSLRAAFRERGNRPLRADINGELRYAMRMETELVFDYVLREDRSLLELIESDYTFLNERLANHYGLTNVLGQEMRRVQLPAGSPRGGILTQGTVLGVTSNPTRTSPVKRGLFILENILGTPPPPPPPNIPPLEDAAKGGERERPPSLRETLALHRENPLCNSCHNRMDPLGLAFEHFNALGMWRDTEYSEPIDATGRLITGEEFHDVRDLKRILVERHARDFYRTVTEKLLTYALGRGLEYYDVETVDRIVARVEAAKGRPSALILGVVESAPFLRTRGPTETQIIKPNKTAQQRADSRIKP